MTANLKPAAAARVRGLASKAIDRAPSQSSTDVVPPPNDNDAPPTADVAVSPAEIRYRAPDLADLIASRAALPWVSLRVGDDKAEVAHLRTGQLALVNGPSGAGKSSFAFEIGWRHSLDAGPVVLSEYELDADETGGRIAGQRTSNGWEDVLRGRVPDDDVRQALALPRLVVLAGVDATMERAETAITTLRAEYPDQPVMWIVDYLQIIPGEGREERSRVAAVVEDVRRRCQRLGVTTVAVSQTSRASAKALKDGDMVGGDTTMSGAETAQLERAASITIALGGMKPREDGTTSIDISIGKGRMGQGDRVLPAVYDGRTGRWAIVGPAVSGAEKRAEQTSAKSDAKRERASLAVLGLLGAADRPQTRQEIQVGAGLTNNERGPVIAALVSSGKVVPVMTGTRKGGFWPLWLPEKAKAAGLRVEEES